MTTKPVFDERAVFAATPVAAPVVLPEPDAYLFQHEETGRTMFVDTQQVEWGFEANNPRLQKISGVYTEQQVRQLLTTGGQGRAVEPFGYVNTYTGQFFKDVEPCRKTNAGHWRTVFAAPQAQADARDARIQELEAQLAAIGAGGVESLRKNSTQ